MNKNIDIIKTTVNIGLSKPVKLLHITDTHITDGGGEEYKGRYDVFNKAFKDSARTYFEQAVSYAKENNLKVVHTGDLIDYSSPENLEYIKKAFDGIDYIFAVGNHDVYQGPAWNKTTFSENIENINIVQPLFKDDFLFSSRVIDGVNFVTMDDTYYTFDLRQTEMLKKEVKKGLPIVLCMHIPIFTPKIARVALEKWKLCTFLLAPDEEYLSKYKEYAVNQQKADELTLNTTEYIKNEPAIKLLITGHTHFNFEETFENGAVQLTTDGSFAGIAREITLI